MRVLRATRRSAPSACGHSKKSSTRHCACLERTQTPPTPAFPYYIPFSRHFVFRLTVVTNSPPNRTTSLIDPPPLVMHPISSHLSSPLNKPPSSPNENKDALPGSSKEPSTPEHYQSRLSLPKHDLTHQAHARESACQINIPIVPFSSPHEQTTTNIAPCNNQITSESLIPRLPPSFRLLEADLWIAEAVKAGTNRFFLTDNQVSNWSASSQHISHEPNYNSILPSVEQYMRSSPTEQPTLIAQNQGYPKSHTIQPLVPLPTGHNPEQIENLNFESGGLFEAPWPPVPKASNKWSCASCSFQFAYKDHLARHRAFVHEGKSESKCSHCNKVYVEFKSLRRHINVRQSPHNPIPTLDADVFLCLFAWVAKSQ